MYIVFTSESNIKEIRHFHHIACGPQTMWSNRPSPPHIYLLFCIVAIIKQYADFNANRLNELQTTFFCALSKASLKASQV